VSWLRGEDRYFVKYECLVELTKLEALLCEHDQIRAAEVIAVRPEEQADTEVVAFLIGDPDQVSAASARDHLMGREEVDLIPDRFIVLDELPLTADGSIDREELMAHLGARGDARGVETGEIHGPLKAMWLEILQLDDVDDNDSFFARGGNSLKATLLLARIKDEFAVDLSVQKFFREPSVRAVARLIATEAKMSRTHHTDLKVVPRDKYRVRLSDVER
jgi:nonribosomal peptide synthetase DhbF